MDCELVFLRFITCRDHFKSNIYNELYNGQHVIIIPKYQIFYHYQNIIHIELYFSQNVSTENKDKNHSTPVWYAMYLHIF